jgi:ATP-dependent DNA helicase DinG
MSLLDAVQAAFAPGGVLACTVDQFHPRPGQTDMAVAVAEAIAGRSVLVAEAGTGVGKTYAYLVPALLSGGRVLVSTATKTLQDQLYTRDLPRLAEALAQPLRCALLKGRGSYLCLHRMAQARENSAAHNPQAAHALTRIELWAQQTRSGDLAELAGLDERSPVVPLVTSTRDNCLGGNCPRLRECHVNQARKEALAADIVVINHHLFFADLAVRESGMAELLPTVETVIFDEAHQLNETGVQFLGRQLATAQVLDLGRDLLATGLQQARGLADWQGLAAALDHAARELRLVAGRAPASGLRLGWDGESPERIDPAPWRRALELLALAADESLRALQMMDELGPDFVRLAERATQQAALARFFLGDRAEDAVRWAEVGHQLRLVESPLDIAATVQARLLGPANTGEGARAWIFTSATLGDDERLSWFTEPCGLQQARVLRFESPFRYAEQAAVYVPRVFPRPGDPGHSDAVAALVARLALPLGGRALVLTTSLRALRDIAQRLPEYLMGSGLDVISQGQLPKRELLQRLRAAGDASGPGTSSGCILVASASFWEGVDIPGDALQLVVIDKLPFPPPNDPLAQARSRRLEAQGRSAFQHYHLPEAAVALKQGAGRLIRSEGDRGLLVVADNRLAQMGYGRRLIAALPPMRRLNAEGEALAFVGTLTRASTMGLC